MNLLVERSKAFDSDSVDTLPDVPFLWLLYCTFKNVLHHLFSLAAINQQTFKFWQPEMPLDSAESIIPCFESYSLRGSDSVTVFLSMLEVLPWDFREEL